MKIFIRLVYTYPDDLLQVAPRVFQGVHGEPRVRVETHVEALDLLVELRQLVEIHFRSCKRGLELLVGLAQSLERKFHYGENHRMMLFAIACISLCQYILIRFQATNDHSQMQLEKAKRISVMKLL